MASAGRSKKKKEVARHKSSEPAVTGQEKKSKEEITPLDYTVTRGLGHCHIHQERAWKRKRKVAVIVRRIIWGPTSSILLYTTVKPRHCCTQQTMYCPGAIHMYCHAVKQTSNCHCCTVLTHHPCTAPSSSCIHCTALTCPCLSSHKSSKP